MILYVLEQGARIARQGGRIVVERGGAVLRSMPAFKLEQIVLMGSVELTPAVTGFVLDQGIDTVFLTYGGRFRGRLVPAAGKNILLRRTQFSRLADLDLAALLARKFVAGKIQNARVLLRRHNRGGKNADVTTAIHRMSGLLAKLDGVTDLEKIRGLEGVAAACYFQSMKHMISAPGFSFQGRNRRPPKDPVNALLSFGYTMLLNTVLTRVHIVGLDPYLGGLHQVDYGRPSLALDLMEEFRPALVDTLVLRMINKRILSIHDFYFDEDAREHCMEAGEGEDMPDLARYPVLLQYEGKKKLVAHYEKMLSSKVLYPVSGKRYAWRDIILEQVRLLARHLKGEDEYLPFVMR